MVGRKHEHEKMVSMLKAAPAELKIVIAGNHDMTLDSDYYAPYGHFTHRGGLEDLNQIRDLYCGAEAKAAGIYYMDEGLETFTLKNGARFTVYASPYQPEFCNWAFAYPRTQDRFNPSLAVSKFKAPNPVPDFPGVDIMLTHGPPHGILDETVHGHKNVGCEHLRRAVQRCRPQLHCFGHIHEGWGAERMDWGCETPTSIKLDGKKMMRDRCASVDISSEGASPLQVGEETLFVNASVMDARYNPRNAPWVVDLDLPRASMGREEDVVA